MLKDRFLNIANKKFSINLNWYFIIAFTFYWIYGLYGFYRLDSLPLNLFISVLFTSLFSVILGLGFKYKSSSDSILFKIEDLIILLLFIVILAIVAHSFLGHSLTSDQISHSYRSNLYSLKITDIVISKLKIDGSYKFKNILFIVNIGMLAFFSVLIFIVTKIKNIKLKILFLATCFIFSRLSFLFLTNLNPTHPPFRLFPLWIVSLFGPINDTLFRIPQFIGLAFLVFALYKILSKTCSKLVSWLFSLSIGSIPVLLYTSSIVEQSIWTAISWTLALIIIGHFDYKKEHNWVRIFSIITVCSLMRGSGFIILVPLGLVYIFYYLYRIKRLNQLFPSVHLKEFVPFLALIPYVLVTLFRGTPASYIPGEVDFIPLDSSSLERIMISIKSGIFWGSIKNSISVYWIAFFPLAFIPVKKCKKNILFIILFFLLATYAFYSIRPALWGKGRYQAEYIIPFIVLGFYNFIIILYKSNRKFFFIPLLMLLIGINFYRFSNIEKSYDEVAYFKNKNYIDYPIISDPIIDYKNLYSEMDKANIVDKTYVIAVSSRLFGEILNGYSIDEINSIKKVYGNSKNLFDSKDVKYIVEQLNSKTEIDFVMIGDYQDKKKMVKELKENGWEEFTFYKENFKIVGIEALRKVSYNSDFNKN